MWEVQPRYADRLLLVSKPTSSLSTECRLLPTIFMSTWLWLKINVACPNRMDYPLLIVTHSTSFSNLVEFKAAWRNPSTNPILISLLNPCGLRVFMAFERAKEAE